MKLSILVRVTAAVVFGCSVASVRADDINQPPWQRFEPNTTYQNWTFGLTNNPTAPDVDFYNPNGTPTATVTNGNWTQYYDQHVGVWTLGTNSSIDLFIPNTPFDPNRHKDLWLQITWQPDLGGSPVVTVNGNAFSLVGSAPVGTGNWIQSTYSTTLATNPASEVLIITGTMDVGEVVLDTQCIPEPSSLALLALGAISLLPYASRKRKLAA